MTFARDIPDTQKEIEYVYTIVRNDLSIEQQAVQACHACIEMTSYYWDRVGFGNECPHLVLCNTSKEDLFKLIEKLKFKEIPFRLFKEADIGNEITAIATAPLKGNDRKIFSNYRLLKREVV